MALKLTEQQEMARDMIKEWVEAEVMPVAAEMDAKGEYPLDLMKRAGELGLLGLTMPVKYGGSGLGACMDQVLAYEVAKAWPGLAMAMAVHGGSTRLLLFNGTEDQKERYIPRAVTGEIIMANNNVDPAGGTNFGYAQNSCTRDGEDIIASVSMPYATNAVAADVIILDTSVDGAPVSLIVDVTDKVTPGAYEMLGMRGAGFGSNTYSGVRVKPENVLPPATALSGLNGTIWLTYAANFLGATEHVYDATREFVMQRTRMDKPLGTFQAVAHAVAKAKINIEAMRGLILNGIDHVTRDNADPVLCFAAKAYCHQMAMKTIESLLELFGGVGVTEEAGIARYMRDSIAAGPGEYPTFALLDIIAQKEGLPVETQLDFVHWTAVGYEGYNEPEE